MFIGVDSTVHPPLLPARIGLSMMLSTLGASLLGNILAGKGIVRAGSGNKKGKGIVRAGYGKNGIPNTA